MKQNFHVQVLDDKEFDSLPYRNISNSLGIADPEKEMAFVRKSGLGKEFDFGTLIHEVNHLIETHKTDVDEYGIMHKGNPLDVISDLFKPAAQAISNTIETTLNRAGPVGEAIGAGGVGVTGGTGGSRLTTGGTAGTGRDLNAPLTPPTNFDVPRGTGNIDELLGKTPITPEPAYTPPAYTPSPSLSQQFSQSQAQQFGEPVTFGGKESTISSSGGQLKSTPTPSGYNLNVLPNLLGSSPTKTSAPVSTPQSIAPVVKPTETLADLGVQEKAPLLGGLSDKVNTQLPSVNIASEPTTTISKPETTATNRVEPAQTWGSKLGKGVESFLTDPKNLLGLGSLAVGAFQKQPEYQMPASVEEIRAKLLAPEGGLTEIGKQAQLELGNILKSTPQELYPTQNDAYYNAALRRTRDSYAEAKKNLDAQYNLAGVYGSGEHLAAQAKLQQQLTNAEADLFAQTEARNFELARTAKYQAIQESLGVDKNVMDDLVGLTGLDVNVAAQMYGAQVADVKAIRDALGTMGVELIKGGMQQGTSQQKIGV